jgi:plastocyanin
MLLRRAPRAALLLLAAPLVLVGCSSTQRVRANGDTATKVPLPPVSGTVYPSPTEAPTAVPTSSASGGAGTVTDTVTGTAENKYDPADPVVILSGGKVTLTVKSVGNSPHTFQSDDLKAFNSGDVPAGKSKKLTFAAKPGSYEFYCLYHKSLGMIGHLTVKAGGAGAPNPSTAGPGAGPVSEQGSSDNKFVPAELTAKADAQGKVTIAFEAKGAHTMQSDAVKGFNSGTVSDTTKTFSFTAKPGTYDYYCLFHKSLGMVGKLTVT